jgi:hypothetical protein
MAKEIKMKSNTLTLTPVVEMHNMYRGKDVSKSIKNINKSNGFEEKNAGLKFDLKEIKVSELIPLESQRITKGNWVEKRLKEQGMDWWAFGTLQVVKDTADQKYYVWDGCGRLAIAQLYANSIGIDIPVPCCVIDGDKKKAAFYFGYSQDAGRRTLSKEVLFVNRWYSNDPDALAEGQQLDLLGLYIKNDSGMSVPENPTLGHYEIGYRAFNEALHNSLMADNDLTLFKQAKDMVANAFSKNPNWNNVIPQDVLWATTCFLKTYPVARKNGLNKAIQDFLVLVALSSKDAKVDWKEKGLSGNAGVAPQLAYGMFKAFTKSAYWKDQFRNVIAFKTLEDTVDNEK